jgi:hypothetical protein
VAAGGVTTGIASPYGMAGELEPPQAPSRTPLRATMSKPGKRVNIRI